MVSINYSWYFVHIIATALNSRSYYYPIPINEKVERLRASNFSKVT